MRVVAEGGASGGLTTMIGEAEWSATGLKGVSIAALGGGMKDVGFAWARAHSRLREMMGASYRPRVERGLAAGAAGSPGGSLGCVTPRRTRRTGYIDVESRGNQCNQ